MEDKCHFYSLTHKPKNKIAQNALTIDDFALRGLSKGDGVGGQNQILLWRNLHLVPRGNAFVSEDSDFAQQNNGRDQRTRIGTTVTNKELLEPISVGFLHNSQTNGGVAGLFSGALSRLEERVGALILTSRGLEQTVRPRQTVRDVEFTDCKSDEQHTEKEGFVHFVPFFSLAL